MSGSASQLWAALPVPALRLGAGSTIEAVNPAAEQALMVSAKALLAAPLFEAFEFETELSAAFEKARREQASLFVADVGLSRGAREYGPCQLRLAPYDAAAGQMLLLITPQDMGALPEQQAGSAARSAIGMAEMLAHEIKNPLAGITGAAQLLSMTLGESDQELTELIVAESRRIVTLLDRVEEFGNLSPPELAPVNLHDVLDRARRSASLGFGAQMQIVEEYDPSLPEALADADQLLQVLLNLLKNASEAAGSGGTIRLRTSYDHGFRLRTKEGLGPLLPLQIEVIDDGPGVPDELKADMFDPFVSGRENGTGLGLALTAKIIAAHDGFVSCRSEPGETVFRIALPRAAGLREGQG